jgi:fimbrial isopeptide formation D2 family protein
VFTAHADTTGNADNYANVTTHEGPYDDDTATVIVKKIPHQNLTCEKKVWDPQTKQWVKVINANVGDTVRFKINISYWGSLAFYSIWINDTLPTCLKYADNATPNEPAINGKKLTWHPTIVLQDGKNTSIEFNALVISNGTNINVVNITGWECGIHHLSCEDTATVKVEKAAEPLIVDAGGPYTGYVSEPIQITGSATGGIPNYTYAWDLNNDGIYNDANGKTISYSWPAQGTKTIYLKVTDRVDKTATDTATVTVNIRNQPPNTPSIPNGKATCKINKKYTFTTSTIDPNGDQVYYWFNWGDNTSSGWMGPFASGATGNASHTWTKKGTYEITVKAKDSHDAESSSSDSFEVKVKFLVSQSIPMPTFLEKLIERFPMLKRFLSNYFSFSF